MEKGSEKEHILAPPLFFWLCGMRINRILIQLSRWINLIV